MKLDFLLLADAAEVGAAGKVSILGGAITQINPSELPFRLPHISAFVRMIAEQGDQGTSHEAQFRWLTPGGKQIGPALGRSFTIEGNTIAEGEHGVALVVETVMLPLTEEGLHRFEFHLDGALVATRDVAVAIRPGDSA